MFDLNQKEFIFSYCCCCYFFFEALKILDFLFVLLKIDREKKKKKVVDILFLAKIHFMNPNMKSNL